jgi:hypothetical protein
MACSRCVEEKVEREFRLFWRQVPKSDKRRFATFTAAVVGAGLGWFSGGGLGVLVGTFLAGSLGEIGGLMCYGDQAVSPAIEDGVGEQVSG